MIIYYKCSFRAGHGFKIGKYDTDSKKLSYISEKSGEIKKALPERIEYTLSNQLGHCLIFATDENGNYFLGVYRLIEGNDDKYVNAVFFDSENPQNMVALYKYFCQNSQQVEESILNSIQRADEKYYQETYLEFKVKEEVISNLLENIRKENVKQKIKRVDPDLLLAFITSDQYQDYQITLEDKFSVDKMFLYEDYKVNKKEEIENYQVVEEYLFKDSVSVMSSEVAAAIWYGALAGLMFLLWILFI